LFRKRLFDPGQISPTRRNVNPPAMHWQSQWHSPLYNLNSGTRRARERRPPRDFTRLEEVVAEP
jgi:hypothetical protein